MFNSYVRFKVALATAPPIGSARLHGMRGSFDQYICCRLGEEGWHSIYPCLSVSIRIYPYMLGEVQVAIIALIDNQYHSSLQATTTYARDYRKRLSNHSQKPESSRQVVDRLLIQFSPATHHLYCTHDRRILYWYRP